MSRERGDLPVAIPAPLLRELYRQARLAFPAECCGWLAGPRTRPGTVDRLRPCTNALAGHRPKTGYAFTPEDLIALANALDSADTARVIYHSHPGGTADFSPVDRRLATDPWGLGPAYPVQHLVVEIDPRQVRAAALYAWSSCSRTFVEVTRYPGDDM